MAQSKLKLKIVYRSNSHAPFWVVAEKSGAWERNGLEVTASPQLVREKAAEALKNRHVDLISGNHHNLYARRARYGEDFVHLAQVANNWTENKIVVSDQIHGIGDLKGKKVALDKLTSHAGLNVWLFLLRQGLDPDRGDVELIPCPGPVEERWGKVIGGEFDATFVGIPHDMRAARAGARVIQAPPMPMIRGVTLTTTTSFVRDHEEEIRRLIRGVAETIHFFLARKGETTEILGRHLPSILRLESEEEVRSLYEEWARSIERKPYPTPEAIQNVFSLALRRDPDIAGFNPLALWDLHYVRELDDTGYIDRLYS